MRRLMPCFTCSFGGRAGGRPDAEPRLAITKENANWVVRWPRGAADFVLQSASDLSASAWTDLPVAGTNTVFQIQAVTTGWQCLFPVETFTVNKNCQQAVSLLL